MSRIPDRSTHMLSKSPAGPVGRGDTPTTKLDHFPPKVIEPGSVNLATRGCLDGVAHMNSA